MQENDLQQKSLFVTHPEHYQRSVHAESMAANIQVIYAQIEDILASLAKTIDGVSPTGASSGQDLLLQVSMAAENRAEIIQQGTLLGLSKLRLFRAVTLESYASDLSAENVFDHVNLMGAIALQVFKDVEVFIGAFEKFGTSFRVDQSYLRNALHEGALSSPAAPADARYFAKLRARLLPTLMPGRVK